MPDPTAPQPVQPPDMVGAGIMQPQAPQSSVVDALRSGGNLPSEIMGMLVPPTTPGQAYASAASGGVAAMRGQPNPVAQMQQAQQQQQMQQAQMMERMQARRQAQEERRQQSMLSMGKVFLDSDDSSSKAFGAQTLGSAFKAMGRDVPQAALDGLSKKKLTEGQMSLAMKYISMPGMSPKTIEEVTGVPHAVQAEIAKNKDSDAFARITTGKSQAQLRQEQAQAQLTDINLWKAQHPAATGEVGAEAELLASEISGGKQSLLGMPDDERAAILSAASKRLEAKKATEQKRAFAEKLELAQVKANIAAAGHKFETKAVAEWTQHGIVPLNDKGEPYMGNPMSTGEEVMSQGYRPVKEKTAQNIQNGKQTFKLFGNMRAQAARLAQTGKLGVAVQLMDKAAQSSPDYAAALAGDAGATDRLASYVKLNAGKFTKDPDIILWFGMESEMIIALRGIGQGEKGVRSMQAFSGAMGTMKAGNYAAVDGYIRNLETSTVAGFPEPYASKAFETSYIIKDKKTGKGQRVYLAPGEALDLARYDVIPEFTMAPRPQ